MLGQVFLLFLFCLGMVSSAQAQNSIQIENANPGTPGWQLANPATNREIEGYASLTSVNVGAPIRFFVSTADSTFTIDVFRTGWYQGIGARLLTTVANLPGTLQPTPAPDPTTGLIECQWTSAYTLNVPPSWTTGIYLARLTGNPSGKQSYMIFVVRNDASASELVFQSSATTFQAYNFWPGGATGKSLYSWAPGGRGWMVSFNRPYTLGFSYVAGVNEDAASGVGAGEYLTNEQPGPNTQSDPYPIYAAAWEFNMVRWLEQNGYDLTYVTNIDVHENASLLLSHKGFLSVGHDEYWSMPMRQNVQNALSAGVNLGFFSSNAIYWQIRLQPGYDGTADRTIVCYKYDAAAQDPDYYTNPQLATTEWRDTPVNMPEAALVGGEYVGDPWNADILVSEASHWLFNGTGLENGSHLTGLLGYEVDSFVPGTSPADTVILTSTPVGPFVDTDDPGLGCSTGCFSNVTWYASGAGSVFSAGTFQWAWGLDDYNAPALRPVLSSAAVQQMTANVLSALVNPATIAVGSALPPGTAAQPYQFTFVTEAGTAPVAWTAAGLPNCLSMSAAGVLSGVPASPGPISFSVTATDAQQHTATGNFNLAVNAAPLQITSTSLPGGSAGAAYSAQLTATGGAPPYLWSATGLPAAITANSAGLLSGVPTAAGTSSVTISVSDTAQAKATATLPLVVTGSALQISTTSLPNATVSVNYSDQLTATGGSPPYKWKVTGLPPGMQSAPDGRLGGAPRVPGMFSEVLSATDASNSTAYSTLPLQVVSAPLVITNAGQLPPGLVNVGYVYQFSAAGGVPPYSWVGINLPVGFALNMNGKLAGKPTAPASYTGSAKATDSASNTTTSSFSLVIQATGVSIAGAGQPLPSGKVGANYLYQFSATGGAPPYKWTGANIPAGLQVSAAGKLGGKPASVGNYSLSITATDSLGGSAQANFKLVID